MDPLSFPLPEARDLFASQTRQLLDAVHSLSELDLLTLSLCVGWSRLELVEHLRIGLDDAKILARVLKIDFDLERITVKSAAEVAPAVQQAEARNIRFFLIDAPTEAFKPLADAMQRAGLSSDEQQAIASGNCRSLLGLN